MGKILRIVTPVAIYQIGRTLPVPEGYPIEPFTVADIIRTDEGFQLLCTPDINDDPELRSRFISEEAAESYASKAREALAEGIVLVAEVPDTDDTRVETLMTHTEYDEMMASAQLVDDEVEVEEPPQ
jgi:hypothetical protein